MERGFDVCLSIFSRIIAQHYAVDSVEALRYTLRPTANLRLKKASRGHFLPHSVEKAAAASALIALISIVAPSPLADFMPVRFESTRYPRAGSLVRWSPPVKQQTELAL